LIHFLAADDCGFINGQAIMLDGGMSCGSNARMFEKLIS
jgi:3alpha(or 20beta)-hydroxysteroid dehydrogenase